MGARSGGASQTEPSRGQRSRGTCRSKGLVVRVSMYQMASVSLRAMSTRAIFLPRWALPVVWRSSGSARGRPVSRGHGWRPRSSPSVQRALDFSARIREECVRPDGSILGRRTAGGATGKGARADPFRSAGPQRRPSRRRWLAPRGSARTRRRLVAPTTDGGRDEQRRREQRKRGGHTAGKGRQWPRRMSP
jgi:hypothetical protein